MTTSLLKSAARALLFAFAALLGAGQAAAQTVEYVHTDALGSVVAVTNAAGVVIERREYEPYGLQLTPAVQNGPGYTAHVQDAATGLTYMQQRYYDPLLGRFLSVDPVTMHDTGDPRHFARYGYANNNPYAFVDPDGRLPILVPIAVVAWRAYSAYDTVSTAANNISTLADAGASTDEKLAAGAELAGSLIGGRAGRQAASGAVRMADDAGHSSKQVGDFDAARREAFDSAGMNDPAKVEFSKVDPDTGTVVEFKGEGGAKVGYDGPHDSPGPHHDTQHISWQSAGKRREGGAQRGNIPYSGERHPSRPDRKEQR